MIHIELVYLLGDSALSLSTDYRWFGRFRNGQEKTNDMDRVECLIQHLPQ